MLRLVLPAREGPGSAIVAMRIDFFPVRAEHLNN